MCEHTHKDTHTQILILDAFPLQELMGRFRGAGTFRQFSTAGTAPVEPLSGQVSNKFLLRGRYFCVALKLLGGDCSDGWRLSVEYDVSGRQQQAPFLKPIRFTRGNTVDAAK